MTRSEAEAELLQFTSGFKRVYRYIQEFIPDHYITVNKVSKYQPDGTYLEEYEINKSESTIEIEGFDKELFIRLLIKEELKLKENIKYYFKIRDVRTDSCVCGAWATLNPGHHAHWCSKGGGWGAGHE